MAKDLIRPVGGPIWQWDLNRTVEVRGSRPGSTVHFAVSGQDEALVVEVREEGGSAVADVPNLLTVEGEPIYCWPVDGDRTLGVQMLPVRPRTRPQGYAYEPTEVVTIEALKQWVEDQIASIETGLGLSYEKLADKPSIEGVELTGDRAFSELGMREATAEDIDAMFSLI